jgi:hypothetical protein
VSTIKSSAENLTLNADGANNDIIFQSNGTTKVTLDGQNTRVGIGITTPSHPLTVDGDGARIAISSTGTYPFLAGFSGFRSGTSHGNMYIETAGGGDFSTPVERIAIEGTTGEVKIATGDLFFGTAGKGIVLGSTTNVDANTLDDYEEGTWTPQDSSAVAYTINGTSRYVKVGRLVHFMADVNQLTSGNSIYGLPFTSVSGAGTGMSIGYTSYGGGVYIYNLNGSTRMDMHTIAGVAISSNNHRFIIGGTYYASS